MSFRLLKINSSLVAHTRDHHTRDLRQANARCSEWDSGDVKWTAITMGLTGARKSLELCARELARSQAEADGVENSIGQP